MDKVQKIREEIEKRLKGERFLSSDKEYNYLLSFIDSLQEEPSIPEIVDEHYWEMLGEESVSEELEKAAIEAFKEIVDDERNSFLEIFKAGAEWGKNQAKVEIQMQSMALAHGCPKEYTTDDLEKAAELYMLNQDTYNSHVEYQIIGAFKAGANWQKQQMMANAVEGAFIRRNRYTK